MIKIADDAYLQNGDDDGQQEIINSALDFEKWYIDPIISKQFKDLNKDQSSGNLNDIEKQAILNIDKVIGILGALQEDGQIDQEVIDIFIRKKNSISLTSLSTSGFLRTLSKTDIQRGDYNLKGYGKEDNGNMYKPGFMKQKK